MICIYITGNLYVIRLLLGSGGEGRLYIFSRRFLQEHLILLTGLLPVLPDNRRAFMLGRGQLDDIIVVFEKLCAEVSSGYRFSKELQQTYLIQLLHLLKKGSFLYYQ